MDDTVLRSYLGRIRDIARLPEEEALVETAKLVADLADYDAAVPFEVHAFEMDLERAREELNSLRRDVAGAQEALAQRVPVDLWRHDDLRRRSEDLARYWSSTIREQLADDLNELRHLAASTAEQLGLDYWGRVVEACLSETFASSQVSARALRDIRQAEGFFASRQVGTEWVPKIHQAKERIARYRAGKRLGEAEVAEAGGNAKKAQKLRAEAAVVLKQDWVEVFPGEPFPENGE